jgi:hypothetical protein
VCEVVFTSKGVQSSKFKVGIVDLFVDREKNAWNYGFKIQHLRLAEGSWLCAKLFSPHGAFKVQSSRLASLICLLIERRTPGITDLKFNI